MLKYVFIGSVEYSAYCLRALLQLGINIVDIMCPSISASKLNADYLDLSEVARDFGKSVYYFEKIKNEATHLKEIKPDVIFVLGLSQIISKDIIEIPTIGCIGSHPALLPANRGRHPIIWAIANGLKKSGITLFWIDEGVDSGDIWGQKEFDIDIPDDASTIYEVVKKLTVEILKEKIPELEAGFIKRTIQDHSMANYWRKRTYKDGEIDWRMSSKRIYDLVRALTSPYVGAHCIYNGKDTKIWKIRILDGVDEFSNLEPGKVISVDGSNIRVKTGDGAIEITAHVFTPLPQAGDYL